MKLFGKGIAPSFGVSMFRVMFPVSAVAMLAVALGCAVNDPTVPPPDHARFGHDYLIQLPGIAGEHSVDHALIAGLRDGGFDGPAEIIDWPGDQAGLGALLNRKRNDQQAEQVAARIVQIIHDDPRARVIVTSHSGGTGVAVWALEKLPANVKVESLFLLSSALSPGYDLTPALRHVRRHAYAFVSENDTIVLSAGTRMFGTIDGVKCDGAGRCGFSAPTNASELQYAKLVQRKYESSWLQYGNDGDHLGTLSRSFSEHVLAPIVLAEFDPSLAAHPSTQPSAPTRSTR